MFTSSIKMVYQQVTIGKRHNGYPILRNGMNVYPGAKGLEPTVIGSGSVVGCNAVVLENV